MAHKLNRQTAARSSFLAYAAAGTLGALAACGGAMEPVAGAESSPSATNAAAQSTATASAGSKASSVTTTMTATPATSSAGAKAPSTTAMMSAASTTPAQAGVAGTAAATSGSSTAGVAGTASAGAPAAAGGAAPPSQAAGGFPRTDEEINVKAKGPYTVMSYEDGLMATEYSAAIMYYPADATPPFAAVALSPGFTAYGTDYEFVGDMLASHGIVALLTTPTTTADLPPQRGEDLVAAVKHLQEENSREGSPLQGKIATDRIGITGHSMGGGGSLYGANSLGDMIRCVVPLQPWQPGGAFPMISAPTLIVGAASDTIAAVAANAQGHYSSIPDSVEKFLVVFQGDHYLSTDRTSGIPQTEKASANENYDPQAAYMVPFYKLFLESDERYRPYLYGSERSMDQVTDYQKSKM